MISVVTPPAAGGPVLQAGRMLADELERRAGVRVSVSVASRLPRGRAGQTTVIGVRDEVEGLMPGLQLAEPVSRSGQPSPEGFVAQHIGARGATDVVVAGNDALGALFGVGWLLREARLTPGWVELPTDAPFASAPHMPLRGAQLGYRDVNNTLDTWGVEQFEQYIRDLVLFGCNSVELTPPVQPPGQDASADDSTRREWEMNLRIAELVHSYGLQVWLWAPVTEHDPREPGGRRRIIDNRRRLFESMAHVDHVFVPGGDPGDTPVDVLLPLLGDVAAALHAAHPQAGMWVSHQGFEPPERDRFYRFLARKRPDWLRGVVHGPWTRDRIEHTRQAVPAEYQLRAYPDITHSCRCQYPVHDWDQAFALVEGREVCNPRPEQHAAILRRLAGHCDGFVAYSDGNHDDASKMLWLALGWDPTMSVREATRRYGRAFVGPGAEEEVSGGLLGLERNWAGVVRRNLSIPKTLATWRRLHGAYPTNWRVKLHYFRSLCDRYVQLKARRDTERERRACSVLELAVTGELPLGVAAGRARRALGAPMPARVRGMREELWVLGHELRESIGLQLSVEFGGRDERGNVLDHLDEPMNNARWLAAGLDETLKLPIARQRSAVWGLLAWEDPGPGGYYDDLGNADGQPHLVEDECWEDDPDCLRHAFGDFSFGQYAATGRLSWRCQATTLYETPLRLRYTGLDPDACYTLRVVYAGRFGTTMRLTANGSVPIHGPQPTPDPPQVLEFPIPREAMADGLLELEWRRVGHHGRGPQVAEAWLVRAN